MIEKRTVSQCISADYCRGYNDAVDEILRCKDCEFHTTDKYAKWVKCPNEAMRGIKEDAYCSYGKRKDVQS